MELVDEFSTIDFSSLPDSISEFFSAQEFSSMSEYEKKHLSNIRQNFEALKRAGLPVKPPEFMVRNKSERERKRICALPLTDSSEDSDAEWKPASQRKRKRATKPQFKPPFRAGTQNVHKKEPNEASSNRKKGKGKRQGNKEKEEEDVHVYPFRKKRVTSFMSMMIPEDDDFLYCEDCNVEYFGDCPEHGPLKIVNDSVVPTTCRKGDDPEYCRKTLPQGLEIKKSKIPKAGLGVFATKFFPVRSRFGPYSGRKETDWMIAYESGYCWQVIRDEKTSHFVDASDPKESNWMRFVNCARSEDEQCLTAYQHEGEVYYRAHKDIHPGMELLVSATDR
ncbi:histone-lysine N-methyltransferase PRDM9-like [Elysia marginata]|uniref:Histone-lysine N-methyltransferase PRDM9-like n=1 Tax=Elysia marginata TaxID=1093978 RepID=A0AAV4FDM6_9GAST|nr:histone-lysine N-methyltransferase PRDM9-like [Elysia marginata]